ncbi:MAG: DNA-directed RNA polymerase subunit alpha, partial [Dehalococcoidia bacterium]|nr:DNA-directed RNA polymerase subunit alpha [Dehalococcoidia bacterium]
EDTVEFLLNVKKLRLRAWTDRPGRMELDRQGPGVVTAADIEVHGDFEIVNPELYLATLDSSEARLTVEFTVEHGRGYVPAGAQDGHVIGKIPVDAIFTPIRKVNYLVENTRVGGATNYDRLTFELWTDGTISPTDAVRRSADLLIKQFSLLTDVGPRPVAPALESGGRRPAVSTQIYEMPIEELELTVRTYNALKRAGITKVGQVLDMSDDDLMAVRNFGKKSLDELKQKLIAHGIVQGEIAEPTNELDEEPAFTEDDSDEYETDDQGNVIFDMFGKPIRKNVGDELE